MATQYLEPQQVPAIKEIKDSVDQAKASAEDAATKAAEAAVSASEAVATAQEATSTAAAATEATTAATETLNENITKIDGAVTAANEAKAEVEARLDIRSIDPETLELSEDKQLKVIGGGTSTEELDDVLDGLNTQLFAGKDINGYLNNDEDVQIISGEVFKINSIWTNQSDIPVGTVFYVDQSRLRENSEIFRYMTMTYNGGDTNSIGSYTYTKVPYVDSISWVDLTLYDETKQYMISSNLHGEHEAGEYPSPYGPYVKITSLDPLQISYKNSLDDSVSETVDANILDYAATDMIAFHVIDFDKRFREVNPSASFKNLYNATHIFFGAEHDQEPDGSKDRPFYTINQYLDFYKKNKTLIDIAGGKVYWREQNVSSQGLAYYNTAISAIVKNAIDALYLDQDGDGYYSHISPSATLIPNYSQADFYINSTGVNIALPDSFSENNAYFNIYFNPELETGIGQTELNVTVGADKVSHLNVYGLTYAISNISKVIIQEIGNTAATSTFYTGDVLQYNYNVISPVTFNTYENKMPRTVVLPNESVVRFTPSRSINRTYHMRSNKAASEINLYIGDTADGANQTGTFNFTKDDSIINSYAPRIINVYNIPSAYNRSRPRYVFNFDANEYCLIRVAPEIYDANLITVNGSSNVTLKRWDY